MEDEAEITLEDLTRTYRQIFADQASPQPGAVPASVEAEDASEELSDEADAGDDPVPVSAEAIVEAMLFVGHPKNAFIPAAELAAVMRGVGVADLDDIVAALNERLAEGGSAMTIESYDGGFRMGLHPSCQHLRGVFRAKTQPVKLSQQAVDCLALVAYRPGSTQKEIEALWNREAASTLRMLIRRSLVELRREGRGKNAIDRYFVADRFYEVVGIDSLGDLPTVDGGS